MARIQALVARAAVPGTRAELTIKGESLPLVQDEAARRLFETYARASARYGTTVGGEVAGGCAEVGFTAGVGCPTLCAVGTVGGRATRRTSAWRSPA